MSEHEQQKMQINEAPKIPKRSSNENVAIWRAIYGTITFIVVGVQAWTARTLISHEAQIAVVKNQQETDGGRILQLETSGSSAQKTHETKDDQRVGEINKTLDRHEGALTSLSASVASIPGKLDTLSERMNNIERGQARLEAALARHMDVVK